MSIVKMDSESAIFHIVESMLPRFSDRQLGLLMGIDMSICDNGFGDDGNTRERKSKTVRPLFYFLFQRPSNYTKVFFWKPKSDVRGSELSPIYSQDNEWQLLSDHDSCWRDAFGSKMTDIYFASTKKFEGRMKSGKPLRSYDLHEFTTFWHPPSYRKLDICRQKDERAERFSTEGRVWVIKTSEISRAKLEMIETPDPKWMGDSGLLIKGSDDHYRFVDSVRRCERAK